MLHTYDISYILDQKHALRLFGSTQFLVTREKKKQSVNYKDHVFLLFILICITMTRNNWHAPHTHAHTHTKQKYQTTTCQFKRRPMITSTFDTLFESNERTKIMTIYCHRAQSKCKSSYTSSSNMCVH